MMTSLEKLTGTRSEWTLETEETVPLPTEFKYLSAETRERNRFPVSCSV